MQRIAIVVGLAACGGGGSDAPTPDAYDTARCLIAGNYGALGALTGTTSQGPSTLTVVLDPGPPRDSFFIKLNSGSGVFKTGLQTGTFQLAGDDLGPSTCGLCVNVIADIVSGQGPTKFYFATGGSVTLTSHTPPAGTLSNVTLVEVANNAPVPGGCTAQITSMMFSGT